MKKFLIDNQLVDHTTYRTRIIEKYCKIKNQTFYDIGAGEAFESLALAHRGARQVTAIEGKKHFYDLAKKTITKKKLRNCKLKKFDARKVNNLEPVDNVICFAFLYHLSNPFNFLKRVRTICKKKLFIETHVAPLNSIGLIPKHKTAFMTTGGVQNIFLDRISFQGRYRHHFGNPLHTKGSLDENWTFWLTPDSLIKALLFSGFEIERYFHEIDLTSPNVIKVYGKKLGFGFSNTKVFIIAKPIGKPMSFDNQSISLSSDYIKRPIIPRPSLLDKVLFRLSPDKFF